MSDVAVHPEVLAPAVAADAGERNGGWESERVAPSAPRELTLFAALGAIGITQWARLVVDPPLGRMLAALVICCAVGASLLWLGRTEGAGRRAGAALVALLGGIGALLAVGLPMRMLVPARWAELGENLRSSLAGIQGASLPYDGPDEWLRLTLLLGVPALLALGCWIAFAPGGHRERRRVFALVPLVAIFAIAVILDAPGAELLWGVLLLALICAWLWIARLPVRGRAAAWAATALAGFVALPLAARLGSTELFDYRDWQVFGSDRAVAFDWNHAYGPLEWPREGTTLLTVRSSSPLYWKTSVLDRFNGIGWQRAASGDPLAAQERDARRSLPDADFLHRHPEWITQAEVDVRALESRVAIGFGIPTSVGGLEDASVSADGTLAIRGEPLEAGDRYSVTGYSPQPTAHELRRAPAHYPERRFDGATLVALSAAAAPTSAIPMPLWGERDAQTRDAVLASPYADTYRLALQLVAGARTPYEAVRAIEDHLRGGAYRYTPDVERHAYPLPAFLFEDRAGYCQQFAGSMALMLRLVGIPARVVSGFAPGSFDPDTGSYEIRDLDAHAWVEVYFRRIGWVTFDPTPPAAPASSQQASGQLAGELQGRNLAAGVTSPEDSGTAKSGGTGGDAHEAFGPQPGNSPPWPAFAIAGVLIGGAAVAAIAAWRRRRALVAGTAADAQVAELRRALERCGWPLPRELTLLGLERRFGSLGRRRVADYAAVLRSHLYSPKPPAPPGPAQRRALRREIAGEGLRPRLRALLVIPPGGPSRSTA